MTKKLGAIFGNDAVEVSASKGVFVLKIGNSEMKAKPLMLAAQTRKEMVVIIKDIQDALSDICWELESYNGFFTGFDPDPVPEETKEEGADE